MKIQFDVEGRQMIDFTYILITVLCVLLLNVMVKGARKAEQSLSPDNFTVTQPIIGFWVGVLCAVVFIAFTVLAVIFPDTAEWWVYVVFIVLSFCGIFLAYYCKVWKLVVTNDTITYINVFGKQRIFVYEDISQVKQKADGIVVYCDEKRVFKIETNCTGYQLLVDQLRERGK